MPGVGLCARGLRLPLPPRASTRPSAATRPAPVASRAVGASLSSGFSGMWGNPAAPGSAQARRRASSVPAVVAMASAAAGAPAVNPFAANPGVTVSPSEQQRFVGTRLRIFFGILIGYACYYLTRNSLNPIAPIMVEDPALGLNITSFGAITSIFPICYGMSKFVSGVLSDRLSPRVMLAGGLLCTAALNIAFGLSSTLPAFMVLWAMNGILQGFGAPSCAKILTAWFATKERGTYWGMWNIAHNLGGFTAPLVASTAAGALGWRWGLFTPGIIAGVVALVLVVTMRDSPEESGFPAVEAAVAAPAAAVVDKTVKLSLRETLVQNVLSKPEVWGLALTYFCVYVVRQGITSWSVFYMIKAKNVADVASAALRFSGLEIGGLVGSMVAGRISDALIAQAAARGDRTVGAVGIRIKVVMGYMVGVAAALLAFWWVPADVWWVQWGVVFTIGFFLYGPQMLIGLCGAEVVGRQSVGASEGFLGWVAYLGAANAGIPLSMIVKTYGWDQFFVALLAACAAAMCLLAPMMNLRSFIQREEDEALKLKAA